MNEMKHSIVLAGGCFWGVEELFRNEPGVVSTKVGYSGGDVESPTYEQVCTGNTGHAEVIKISYDPRKTSLKKILHFFFSIHNPTTLNQQGNDIGSQYRSTIFFSNNEEERIAREVIDEVDELNFYTGPIVTTLEPLKNFYSAEDYHQEYLQKNPGGYTCHFKRY